LGHLTCKIVSEMTYNVSSGTLNPTIPYWATLGRNYKKILPLHYVTASLLTTLYSMKTFVQKQFFS